MGVGCSGFRPLSVNNLDVLGADQHLSDVRHAQGLTEVQLLDVHTEHLTDVPHNLNTLDRVNPQIRLQIQIGLNQLKRITRTLSKSLTQSGTHRILVNTGTIPSLLNDPRPRRLKHLTLSINNLDVLGADQHLSDVRHAQGLTEVQLLDVHTEHLTDVPHNLNTLDRVNPQIRLQIQIGLNQLKRITRTLSKSLTQSGTHRILVNTGTIQSLLNDPRPLRLKHLTLSINNLDVCGRHTSRANPGQCCENISRAISMSRPVVEMRNGHITKIHLRRHKFTQHRTRATVKIHVDPGILSDLETVTEVKLSDQLSGKKTRKRLK